MDSGNSPSVPPEFIHAMAENARRENALEAEAAAGRLAEARSEAKRLATELEAGYRSIQELLSKNRRATERIEAGANDELDWAALGYTLHNIYCAFENYFLRIAKFFENGLDQRFWHGELLDRMTGVLIADQ
ncbi:MAG: hypothetical protein ACLQMF_07505 [Rectinemataceae bacterium]